MRFDAPMIITLSEGLHLYNDVSGKNGYYLATE